MKIQRKDITDLVAEPYFSRGRQYFREGMVKLIKVADKNVKAKAVGSCVYSVEFCYKNDKILAKCSCPAFRDFGPCKHIAATGLAVIEHNAGGYFSNEECSHSIHEHDEFEKALKVKTKQDLIKMIVDLSGSYPEIMEEIEWL